jgi:hypothetical protein
VTCWATGIAAGGATVTVTGGGAITVTVVVGAAGVGVDIEMTGVTVGPCAVVALVDGAHAASAAAAIAKTHTWGRAIAREIRGSAWPRVGRLSCMFSAMSVSFR